MSMERYDHQSINKLLPLADAQTLELAKQKTIEFARLMSYYKCAMMTIEAKLKWKFNCAQLRWTVGQAWSISSGTKKILFLLRKWQTNFMNVLK